MATSSPDAVQRTVQWCGSDSTLPMDKTVMHISSPSVGDRMGSPPSTAQSILSPDDRPLETGGPQGLLPTLSLGAATRAAVLIVNAMPPCTDNAHVITDLLRRAFEALMGLSLVTSDVLVYAATILRRAARHTDPENATLSVRTARRMVLAGVSIASKMHGDAYYRLDTLARALLPDPRRVPSKPLVAAVLDAERKLLLALQYDVTITADEFGEVWQLVTAAPPEAPDG